MESFDPLQSKKDLPCKESFKLTLNAKDTAIDRVLKVFERVMVIAKSTGPERGLIFYSFSPSTGKFSRENSLPEFTVPFNIEHYQLHVN